MQREKLQKPMDTFAITLSGLCLLHCLLMPFLIAVFPILTTTLLGDENFHKMLLWLVLPTSGIGLFLGCYRHKDKLVLSCGLTGILYLLAAATLGHQLFGELGERLLTIAGGLILASGHWRNYRLCRENNCEN